MKKITSFLAALLILSSAVSCQRKGTSDSASEGGSSVGASSGTAEELSVSMPTRLNKMYYTKEKLAFPSELVNGYFMAPFEGGSRYFVTGSDIDFEPLYYIASEEFTRFDRVEFEDFDTGINYAVTVTDDGNIVTFVNHVDYGDLPEPDYSDPDFDQDKYDAAAKYTYMVKTYSAEGKLISSNVIDREYEGCADKYSQLGEMCSDGRYIAILLDGAYELFDIEGNYLGELKNGEMLTEGIGINSNGELICAVRPKENQLMLCTVGEGGRLTETETVYALSDSVIGAMMAGTGDYSLFARTTSAIYGIRIDDGKMEMLFDMNGSGVGTHDVRGYKLGNDGNFILLSNNFRDPTELTRFIPKTPEEIAAMPVITLGFCTSGNDVSYYDQEYINPWNNDSSHDFRVELKLYQYGCDVVNNDQIVFSGLDEITEDVLSGNLPDVLFMDGNGTFGRINMLDKDALCDLYDFMDSDRTYTRDAFVPNALKCLEYGGKLPFIAPRFNIDRGWFLKTKFVGDSDASSREKRLELLLDPPVEVEKWGDDSKLYRAYGWSDERVLSYKDWADLEKGTCDFNSDSFIRFLKYCNEAEVAEIDYEHYFYEDPTAGMTQSEAEEYQNEQSRREYLKYIEDRAIFNELRETGYSAYAQCMRGQMGGEPVTFLDEPHLEFDTLMGINANSDKKDMAWEYIRSFISYETYDNANYFDERGMCLTAGFPITKDGLKHDEEFDRSYSYSSQFLPDDDPEKADYKGLVYIVDYKDHSYNIKLGELTDEDIAAVNSAIENAKPKMYIDLTDDTFEQIAREEMLRYFNGGCTAEQCADAMQSRLEIYLSERYST